MRGLPTVPAPTLIHGFHLTKSGPACLHVAEAARLPFVLTLSGTDIAFDLQNPMLAQILLPTLGKADRVIVPYAALRIAVQEYLPEPGRVVVIPKGVEIRPFPKTWPMTREQFGLAAHHRLVLLPGGILPAKKYLFAVAQFERLPRSFPMCGWSLPENRKTPTIRAASMRRWPASPGP
jgi:hypothetical protein